MKRGTLIRIALFCLCILTVFFTILAHGTMTGGRVALFLVAMAIGSALIYLLDKQCDKGFDIRKAPKLIDAIAIVAIVLAALSIRLLFLKFETEDSVAFFAMWVDKFKELGIKTSLGANITDYSPLYSTILTLLSLLPIKSLTIVKLVPIACDFVIGLAALLIYNFYKGEKANTLERVIILFASLLNPISVLNSSAWGQCDSAYACFILLGVYFLSKVEKEGDKYSDTAVILFALAISIKLQAIFSLPVLLYFYVAKKRTEENKGIRLSQFVWFPIVYFASSVPMFLCGKTIKDIFLVYAKETGEYNNSLTLRYYNFFTLIGDKLNEVNFDSFFMYGMIMAVTVLLLIYFLAYKADTELSIDKLLLMLVVTVLTLNYFLPSMHERYAYVAEISIVILACLKKKYILPAVATVICTLSAYGDYLTMGNLSVVIPSYIVAVTRVAVLIYLALDLVKKNEGLGLEGTLIGTDI